MTREEQFMQEAVRIGVEGMRNDVGGPFGCVIVKGDEIVGRGCNTVLLSNDPTSHAEIVAIRDACRTLNDFQLKDCELYTSCEPCPMCLGAIYWARPERVYYACSRGDAADAGFDDSFIYDEIAKGTDSRKIPMIPLDASGSKQMFDEWKAKENKKLY